MKVNKDLQKKPIGEILQEAGLIYPAQIEMALIEQSIYTNLKLGEILVLHGWLNEQTADFFGEKIKPLIAKKEKRLIGHYFYEAGLLSREDIEAILHQQQQLGLKFGSVAVLRGCIKQETLDFFLKHFCLDNSRRTKFSYQDTNILEIKQRFLNARLYLYNLLNA